VPKDPIHHYAKESRRGSTTMIKNAKKQHWEGFLAMLDDRSVWTEHHYASGDPMDGRKA